MGRAANIPENSSVSLSGGEIGTLNRKQVSTLFSLLKSKNVTIDVLTNGLFIERYPEYLNQVSEVLYHCLEDLSGDIQFPDIKRPDFYYILVVNTDDVNTGKVETVFNRYPHIKFILSPNIKMGQRIHMNDFLPFMKRNREHIHERTMAEFVKNLSRA